MDFEKMDLATLTNGVNEGGQRYLELFLIEYRSLFNEAVNPGCNNCLNSYLTRYKKHKAMSDKKNNNSGYRLLAQYENIPLEFGSPILVNNGNLTDEYAKKLLERPNGKQLFSVIPTVSIADLQAELDEAKAAQSKLARNAKKEVKQAAADRVANAEAKLAEYAEAETEQLSAPGQDDINEIEVTLTDDDIEKHPELKEKGFAVGETIIIDKEKYDADGTIVPIDEEE